MGKHNGHKKQAQRVPHTRKQRLHGIDKKIEIHAVLLCASARLSFLSKGHSPVMQVFQRQIACTAAEKNRVTPARLYETGGILIFIIQKLPLYGYRRFTEHKPSEDFRFRLMRASFKKTALRRFCVARHSARKGRPIFPLGFSALLGNAGPKGAGVRFTCMTAGAEIRL